MKRTILTLLLLSSCTVARGQAPDLEPLPLPPTTASTTTTVPATTTTTTLPDLSGVDFTAIAREQYGQCGEWYTTAIEAGFTDSDWKTLRRIIARETGDTCKPDLLNNNSSTGDYSFGLTQINMRGKLGPSRMYHCELDHPYDLFDPLTNLKCAHLLYTWSGWKPWGM